MKSLTGDIRLLHAQTMVRYRSGAIPHGPNSLTRLSVDLSPPEKAHCEVRGDTKIE
jgi:hypothetical protein